MPPILKITAQERAKRLDQVRQALASVRLEGLEPGGEAQSIYQRYVDGEFTLEQMGARLRRCMTESTDPYLYPGTDVPKNLRGIRDPNTLSQFEAESTTRRIVQLINSPVQCRFDTVCLRAIHRHIFQDVYSWAGQFRTVNISKGGHLFGVAAFVEPALDDMLRNLIREHYLMGTDS